MPQLLIIRHAIAKEREAAARLGISDTERPLTKKGVTRMKAITAGIAGHIPTPACLLSSPLLRAYQTAELLAADYPGLAVTTEKGLSPGAPLMPLVTTLQQQANEGVSILIGHEPDLGKLISLLLFGKATTAIQLKKGGAALLGFPRCIDSGQATLLWLMTPRQLKAQGEKSLANRDKPLAELPIGTALLQLLTSKQKEINRDCDRFTRIGNPESLHNLRVSIRRLHSIFIGFTSCFQYGDTISETLHTLLRKTNHARDLEVALALLSRHQPALPWLQQQWQHELNDEYRLLRKHLPPAWWALSQQFGTPKALLSGSLPVTTLGRFTAGEMKKQEKELLKKMTYTFKQWDEKRTHKLRLQGKRLRYLLEPFAEQQPGAARAVGRLKRFQDMLGDYHDLAVLQKRLRQLRQNANKKRNKVLVGAVQQLKQEQQRLRQTIRKDYRGRASRKLGNALSTARKELAQE